MMPPPQPDRLAEITHTLALLDRIEAVMDRFPRARDFAEAARLAGWTDAEIAEAVRLLPSLRGSGAPP